MSKKLTPPTPEDELLLNSVVEDKADEIMLRKKKCRVRWMRNCTLRKVSDIQHTEKDELKVNTKCVAAMLLNDYWKIRFFWPFLWRWFYYVKQYSDEELLPVIALCKKKVLVESYYAATILLTEMRDTVMQMSREEVRRFRRESIGAQRGRSEKNTSV